MFDSLVIEVIIFFGSSGAATYCVERENYSDENVIPIAYSHRAAHNWPSVVRVWSV